MIKTGIYIDFGIAYERILKKLNISFDPDQVTDFQLEFLKRIIERFFGKLCRVLMFSENDRTLLHTPVCLKAITTYEKLPLSEKFHPNFKVFLYSIGVTPVNSYSPLLGSGEGSSSVFILTVIEDLLVKKIPVDSVVISTSNTELLPLITWLREHTGKEIVHASFPCEKKNLFNNPASKFIDLNWYLREAVVDTLILIKQVRKQIVHIPQFTRLHKEDLLFLRKLRESFF